MAPQISISSRMIHHWITSYRTACYTLQHSLQESVVPCKQESYRNPVSSLRKKLLTILTFDGVNQATHSIESEFRRNSRQDPIESAESVMCPYRSEVLPGKAWAADTGPRPTPSGLENPCALDLIEYQVRLDHPSSPDFGPPHSRATAGALASQTYKTNLLQPRKASRSRIASAYYPVTATSCTQYHILLQRTTQ